ncbi:MAG: YraN family protein [Parcubacteria group bacterium]
MKSEKRRVGDVGESVACEFLRRRGFEIVERNYLRKWGEIDIVAKKEGILRFIEVKSVSCLTSQFTREASTHEGGQHSVLTSVTHVTTKQAQDTLDTYRPEDNMHPAKLRRLARTMQIYLLEKNLDCEWQLDVVTVRIDEKGRRARAEIIENVII